MTSPGRRKLRIATGVVVLAAIAVFAIKWTTRSLSPEQAARQLNDARMLAAKGDYTAAKRLALEVLNSETVFASDALIIAAASASALDEAQEAISYLERISKDDEKWSEARLKMAQLHHEHARIAHAMSCYRDVLSVSPRDGESNLGMARLLAMSCRRADAIPFILQLIPLNMEGKLPMLLILDESVITNREFIKRALREDPDDPNPRIAEAWHLMEEERFDEALKYLREAVRLAPELAAAWDALGTGLMRAGRYEDLGNWLENCPLEINAYADSWIVRAELAKRNNDQSGSVRCLLEAARIWPESRMLQFKLQQALGQSGNTDVAKTQEPHLNRLVALRTHVTRIFSPGAPPDARDLTRLAIILADSGRFWEAFSWGRIALEIDDSDDEFVQRFNTIARRCRELPMVQTAPEFNSINNVRIADFSLPSTQSISVTKQAEVQRETSIRFKTVADSGLNFTFFPGYDSQPQHRMFEFSGGGLGVCDFDLDGTPDVYCTQGTRHWGEVNSRDSDVLFRNAAGTRFEDVSLAANISEFAFGQGVCCGDVNSDGFPDIYVANIGENTLWINCGDGTFIRHTFKEHPRDNRWTTSCLIADVDGDKNADLYDVNYVTAPDVYERTCTNAAGRPSQCRPFDFDGESDQIYVNDSRGGFENRTQSVFDAPPSGKGLGVVAWDTDMSGRLSLFITNDSTPNHFLRPEPNHATFRLSDQAFAAGVSVNEIGKPEACMGVTIGDVDGNGFFDIHVTNFRNESNTLYASLGAAMFEDRTRDFGLHQPTWQNLAWGTELFDADSDGRLELMVSNGHLEEDQPEGGTYRIRPQLFQWTGSRFSEINGNQIGEYFETAHVGRATAIIDWNLDDKPDLLMGHREEPYALITNITDATNGTVTIRLIGIESPRDSIGTTVEATIGTSRLTYQLTAGDGYQSSNERLIRVGCGNAQSVDRITVKWPSGHTQQLSSVPVKSHLTIVEGRGNEGYYRIR